MYKCKHFLIQEIVPKHIYDKWGDKAWMFCDEQLAVSLDQVREYAGPCLINNWHTGGKFQWRGMRTKECPEYSELSMHTYFKAADVTPLTKTVEEVRAYVLANPVKFPYITGIELEVSWFHFDCRNTDQYYQFKK